MKKAIVIVLSVILICALPACSRNNSPAQKPQLPQQGGQLQQGGQEQARQGGQEQAQFDPELAEKVKRAVKAVEGVEDSTAVVINKDISAAIKVTGFNRLQLKKIKEEAYKKIKNANHGYTVRLTSDKKLFSLIQKAEGDAGKNPRGDEAREIKQQVDKINQDMRG
jgi:uncharacterized membrane protein